LEPRHNVDLERFASESEQSLRGVVYRARKPDEANRPAKDSIPGRKGLDLFDELRGMEPNEVLQGAGSVD
jgi:hypothetical protein